MPQPIQFSADAARVAAALRTLLTALEAHPVRKARLSLAWDEFRAAFGDGPAPDGVPVDSTGRPDIYGLRALIRASTGVSAEARDALQDVTDAIPGVVGGCARVFRDSAGAPEPTPDQLREHERNARDADDAPIRQAKAAIRSALTHLPTSPPTTRTADNSQTTFVPHPPPADPVFAEAAAAATRRRDYDARVATDHKELRRVCRLLEDASEHRAATPEELVAGWASALVAAARALDRAGLADLWADEPGEWMPRRLACAALRAAARCQAEAEQAVRLIFADTEHRNSVGPALTDIARRAERRLRERQEAALRRDYPDLAPRGEPDGTPTTSAGYDPSECEPSTFAELATWLAEREYSTRPDSRPRRIPVTARGTDLLYLQSYCEATFGSWGLEALAELRGQYAVQTDVATDQNSPTPLREIADHFRALGIQVPAAPATSLPAPRPKRSTERGEGREKLIAALTKHHRYGDGGCLNPEPVGNNELARLADVEQSTASEFFKREFQGHAKYKALCRDAGRLAAALKLLNNEFAPHDLYGRRPTGEGGEDDRE